MVRMLIFPILCFLCLAVFESDGYSAMVPGDAQSHVARPLSPRALLKTALKQPATADEHNYRDGEVLVKFRTGTDNTGRQRFHERHGTKKVKEYPGLRLERIKIRQGDTVVEAVKRLKNDPAIEYVEPDYVQKIQATPTDPRFVEQWSLANSGQTGGTSGADMKAKAAWDLTTGSNQVYVAVIDTGIDYNHPDLAANVWTNPGEIPGNGLDDDGNGYIDDIHGYNAITNGGDPLDDNGHGTHVAGSIGAVGNNAVGVTGVNWNVRMIACKFLNSGGSGYTSDAVECLLYVKSLKDRGIPIVATNNSWGGGSFSQALLDAINAQQDILFMAAAGNDSNNNDAGPSYPPSYDAPNIIAVAATDHNDRIASFSNYGKRTVHVGAPGVNILSTMSATNNFSITDSYGTLSGTSMATPHVTGLAALLKAQDSQRDWRQIRNLIIAGGDDTLLLREKTASGKRISALGSLSCNNKPLLVPLKYPSFPVPLGISTTISAQSINCSAPAGPVTVTTPGGQTISLIDDGIAPDAVAGDGIFTASWTPPTDAGTIHYLKFLSPAGTVFVPPLNVTRYLPQANLDVPYSQTIHVTDGIPPYTITLSGGSLPTGLSMDAAGVISGTPAATGSFTFSLNISDSVGRTSGKLYTLEVTDDMVIEKNALILENGNYSVPKATATDASGNIYVAGSVSNGSYDMVQTVKYDPAGNVAWSAVYDGGSSRSAEGIAVDASGNVIVVGGKPTFGGLPDALILKYDANGNQVWAKSYDNAGKSDYFFDVAVDATGNIYATGFSDFLITGVGNRNELLLAKFNTAGDLQWERIVNDGDLVQGFGVTVDQSGNIYVAGDRATAVPTGSNSVQFWYTFLTIKYAPDGTLFWSRTFGEPGWERANSVAADATGNIYVAGEMTYPSFFKLDTNGNLLWSANFCQNGFCPQLLQVIIDGNGNPTLFGIIYDGVSAYNYWIGKSTTSGSLLWSKKIQGDNQDYLRISGALDKDNNLCISRPFETRFLTSTFHEALHANKKALPGAQRGIPYSQGLEAMGGTAPYTWALTAGSLPDGLTFDPGRGMISGTPTTSGTTSFTLQLGDAHGTTVAIPLSITVFEPVMITTETVANSIMEASYYQQLAVTGGSPPYKWVVSGVPFGLNINQDTGELTGSPTMAWASNFSAIVTDANGFSATRSYWIQVLGINDTAPPAILGLGYNYMLYGGGGTEPYTWTIASGAIPPGFSLNDTHQWNAYITGTPTATGSYNFSVKIQDSAGLSYTKPMTIDITPPACQASPIRLPHTPIHYYDLLDSVLPYTSAQDTIQLQAVNITGSTTIDKMWYTLSFKGGYDCYFTATSGYTDMQGNVTVSNGTITLENLRIHGTLLLTGGISTLEQICVQ
ncbi:S8 family serine peptidase [Geotalea sp. SG265]|uniref:S8 family serine peptidase n=1 Tax=Geotalea sp. SG265 TaxID=2922867 RepID=UPI001FAFCE5B|nr:S8 family serine peptidase [Geotalea sp. SG265]